MNVAAEQKEGIAQRMKAKHSNGVPGRLLNQNQEIRIRDIIKRAEPEVLKSTGLESQRNGTTVTPASSRSLVLRCADEHNRLLKPLRVPKRLLAAALRAR